MAQGLIPTRLFLFLTPHQGWVLIMEGCPKLAELGGSTLEKVLFLVFLGMTARSSGVLGCPS